MPVAIEILLAGWVENVNAMRPEKIAANGHKSRKYPLFFGNTSVFFCIYRISWESAVIKQAIAAPSFFRIGIKRIQLNMFIVNETAMTKKMSFRFPFAKLIVHK